MINRPNDWDNVKAAGDFETLPVGAYKIKINAVKIQDNSDKGYSNQLLLQYDIAEGEYAGFYKRQYDANNSEDRKYKGIYRVYLPKDDGSEQDSWTKSKFKAVTNAFEDSNNDYVWDWDEQKLKGLVVGAVFNQKEYDFNGKHGFFTNLYKLIPISEIATAKIPEPTKLKESTSSSDNSFMNVPSGIDDEVPFN